MMLARWLGQVVLLPALLALVIGARGSWRAGAGVALGLGAAALALRYPALWPPSGALGLLPLLAPLALLAQSARASLSALATLAIGGLSLHLALANREPLVAGLTLAFLAAGGALVHRAGRATPGLLVVLGLLAALLALASSVSLGALALALTAASAAVLLRGGDPGPVARVLALVLLAFGMLLADLAPPSAVLGALGVLSRGRRAIGLAVAGLTLQAAFEVLVPGLATAG